MEDSIVQVTTEFTKAMNLDGGPIEVWVNAGPQEWPLCIIGSWVIDEST
jgi:hypothetical protein